MGFLFFFLHQNNHVNAFPKGEYVFKDEIITNLQTGAKVTNKKKSEGDRTVILSDEYVSESGVQGGKIIAEHLALGCFLFGIPFFLIGLLSLFYMLFVVGFPKALSGFLILISPQSLATIIGLSLIISGFFVYKDQHSKKLA